MKVKTDSKRVLKIGEPAKTMAKMQDIGTTASGRWSAVQRVRLPHKFGLPLSSGGGGDGCSIDKAS